MSKTRNSVGEELKVPVCEDGGERSLGCSRYFYNTNNHSAIIAKRNMFLELKKNKDIVVTHADTGSKTRPRGRPRSDYWARAVVCDLLSAEVRARNMCQRHVLFQYGFKNNTSFFSTKYRLDDDTEELHAIKEYVDMKMGNGGEELEQLRSPDGAVLVSSEEVVGRTCCGKLRCLQRLTAVQIDGLRSVSRRLSREDRFTYIGACMWSPVAEVDGKVNGRKLMCRDSVHLIWGISYNSHARLKKSVRDGHGVASTPPPDGRLQRQGVPTVLTLAMRAAISEYLEDMKDLYATPEAAVVKLDVSGKRGLHRTFCLRTPSSINYSTFKRFLREYEEKNGLKFKRRHKDHSLCGRCFELESSRVVIEGALASVRSSRPLPTTSATPSTEADFDIDGIVEDLLADLNELQIAVREHQRAAFDRLEASMNVRCWALMEAVRQGQDVNIPNVDIPALFSSDEADLDGDGNSTYFGMHIDAKSRVDLPNCVRAVAEASLTDKTSYELWGIVSFERVHALFLLADSSHGSKTAEMVCDILFLSVRRLPRARQRRVIFTLDNVGIQKSGLVVHCLAALVDVGVLEAAIVLFTYANHGKWLADSGFGRFMSCIFNSNPMRVCADHLAVGIDAMPPAGANSSIILETCGRHGWRDVIKALGVRDSKPPQNLHFATASGYVVSSHFPLTAHVFFDDALACLAAARGPDNDDIGRLLDDIVTGTGDISFTPWKLKLNTGGLDIFTEVVNSNILREPIRAINDYELGRCGWGCCKLPYVRPEPQWIAKRDDADAPVIPVDVAARRPFPQIPQPPRHFSWDMQAEAREKLRNKRKNTEQVAQGDHVEPQHADSGSSTSTGRKRGRPRKTDDDEEANPIRKRARKIHSAAAMLNKVKKAYNYVTLRIPGKVTSQT